MCVVCAETREMWKKSGAWFFRALPAYVLPERRAPRVSYCAGAALQQEGADEECEECAGSPAAAAGAQPPLSRQHSASCSCSEGRGAPGSPHEAEGELARGVSALSLARADSAPRTARPPHALRRSASRGSACSVRQEAGAALSASPPGPPAPLAAERAPAIPDAGHGTLELRLAAGGEGEGAPALTVTVLRARGLRGTDATGLADPFCELRILPSEGSQCQSARTRTVHKTRNPEFNETVTFYGVTECDLAARSLEVVVHDDDRYGCDELGSATVALREAASEGHAAPLRLALSCAEGADEARAGPRVLLALCYSTKRRALAATVCRAADLPARDSNGYSDPFVKLHLEPDPYRKKHKTSTKWRTLNPVWNEQFVFETRPTELARQSLALSVWDRDYGKRDDFLGALVLGAASKGRRLRHWAACLQLPDRRHERWHALADTQAPPPPGTPAAPRP